MSLLAGHGAHIYSMTKARSTHSVLRCISHNRKPTEEFPDKATQCLFSGVHDWKCVVIQSKPQK
jgi:hypothetical protein